MEAAELRRGRVLDQSNKQTKQNQPTNTNIPPLVLDGGWGIANKTNKQKINKQNCEMGVFHHLSHTTTPDRTLMR